jgi:hypothetical protein
MPHVERTALGQTTRAAVVEGTVEVASRQAWGIRYTLMPWGGRPTSGGSDDVEGNASPPSPGYPAAAAARR